MDKLTRSLLASLGSGILLGTGLKLGETLTSRRGPPRDFEEERLARRLRAIERRLRRMESPTPAPAPPDSLETRINARFEKLEKESASQSLALGELRASAEKTEQSVQRLIAGLDRWLSAQPLSRQRDPE